MQQVKLVCSYSSYNLNNLHKNKIYTKHLLCYYGSLAKEKWNIFIKYIFLKVLLSLHWFNHNYV